MTIGIDAKSLSRKHTGIAVYVKEVISWMQKIENGNEYILFSNAEFEMPEDWVNCKKVIYRTYLPGSLFICFLLDGWMRKYHIDVFWGAEHCIPLSRCHFKKIVTIHDLAVTLHPGWGTNYNALFQRLFVSNCARASDAVAAISNSTKRDIIKFCGIDEKKIRVIYNGDSPYQYREKSFSEREENEIRRKFHIEGGFLLYCGTIEPRKNITGIVKAFNHFRANSLADVKLVLCGALGWKYKKIIGEIETSPYRDDIVMTGYVTETEKEFFYRNTIALLFPSHYEGFGFPILEAMSCGVPVITARNSSLEEVGGDAALYVDDEDDFEKISHLISLVEGFDDSRRKEAGMKGKIRARQFSRKICAEEMLSLFKSVLAQADEKAH